MARRESLTFHLYVAPWIIGFLVFTLGPMIYSLYLSFTNTLLGYSGKWTGFANYLFMFTKDRLFWRALLNTAYFAFVSIPVGLVLAFFLASLLNLNLRGINVFRSVFYVPSVVSGVAVILLWGWILNPEYGLLNWLLSLVGIKGPSWLGDPAWAMPALILMSLWNVGGSMVIFLASLQGVPQELYESADMDGASGWTKTMRITVPFISSVVLFNLILGIISGVQVFTQVYILTSIQGGSIGGPLNATYTYVLHLFLSGFRYMKIAYGSGLAWILFLVTLAMTLVVMRTSRRWVYYSGGGED